MPGLYEQKSDATKNVQKQVVCKCKSCACKNFESKRPPGSKKTIPPNAIVFQLPKYREPKADTYSHTIYKKEICNKSLMKQHAVLAQKKASERSKQAPIFEQERFACKTTAGSELRKYTSKQVAACKAKFPRTKRKEDFYFNPGEYTCNVKFLLHPVSHEDYSPKSPIPSTYRKDARQCDIPPFDGISCYDRDFRAPPVEAYPVSRKLRKRVVFD